MNSYQQRSSKILGEIVLLSNQVNLGTAFKSEKHELTQMKRCNPEFMNPAQEFLP
jgi:hypothetical protein